MQPFLQNLYFCKILRAFGGSQRFHFLRARGPQASHWGRSMSISLGSSSVSLGSTSISMGPIRSHERSTRVSFDMLVDPMHGCTKRRCACAQEFFDKMRLGLRSEWPFLKPMSLWISFLMFSNKEFNYLERSMIKMRPCN